MNSWKSTTLIYLLLLSVLSWSGIGLAASSADSSVELEYWNAAKESKNSRDLDTYLIKFPKGQFVDLARNRLGGGNWIADKNNGCNIWNSSPKPNETASWSGECFEGKARGKGVIEYNFEHSREITEATFLDGRDIGDFSSKLYENNKLIATGQGVTQYNIGGHKERKGALTILKEGSNIVSFDGYIIDGEQTSGKLTFANGDIYQGGIQKKKFHGNGKFVRANGDWSDGIFDMGNFLSGKSKFTKDRVEFEGNVAEGKQNGVGKMVWKDGPAVSYEGDFKDGKQTGRGKFVSRNGADYEGEVVNGKPNGVGKFVWKGSSAYYEGEFKDGKQTGRGKAVYLNGATYEGDFLDGKAHGHGKGAGPDGIQREGDFVNNNFIRPTTIGNTQPQQNNTSQQYNDPNVAKIPPPEVR